MDLEIVVAGRRVPVPAGRPFVIGRGPAVDLDLPGPHVSRTHLVVEPAPTGWTLTDHSRFGSWAHGRRITGPLPLHGPTTVQLGSPPDVTVLEFRPVPTGGPAPLGPSGPTPLGSSVSLPLPPAGPTPVAATPRGGVLARQGGGPTRSFDLGGQGAGAAQGARITVGRLPDNDVPLDDLLVSRRHAELRRDPSGWRISDLGSGNGTFVNGVRVQTAPVSPRDVIGIGHALLQLQGDRLVAAVDTGDVAYEVRDISVRTSEGKRLLCDVGFALPGRSLLAVVGPSGAGKSTLLRALTGSRPADVGEVRYAGRDLYAEYDELRHRIGLVPQDDVLHPQLTVLTALRYAARLRFPADVTKADRERRIAEVLHELGLTNQAQQRIDTLSGGQRKRTSVALELLTKPSLLFLDEPTSGLDPGLDKSVMQTLRGLADGTGGGSGDGRTVVVVTHSVANLDQCDRLLVLAPGGHVAYFGPPAEALPYFGQPDFAEMFLLLDRVPGEVLGRRYRESQHHRRYVASATGRMSPVAQRSAPGVAPPQQRFGTQLAVLCRRYLSVIAADKQYAVFLAALPLLLSVLARLVPGDSGLSVSAAVAAGDGQPLQLVLVLIVGGSLVGLAAAIRELVKERPVYVRERAIGLSPIAYLLSKLLVLGVLCGVQAVVFTLVSLLGRDAPDEAVLLGSPMAEVVLAVVAVTLASMVVGLLISALVDNADRAMPLLVLVLMLQLVVSGGIFPVHGRVVLEQLAWLVPSRWAFAMGATTVDMNVLRTEPDPLWEHTAGRYLLAVFVLLLLVGVLVALTVVLLRRLDPVRARR